jgi:uncharacterized protein
MNDPELAAALRLFRSALGAHLFLADGSRIYDLAPNAAVQVEQALQGGGEHTADELWSALGLLPHDALPRRIDGRPLDPPAVSSMSLNVMQACNMSCGYCYADEGRFAAGHG